MAAQLRRLAVLTPLAIAFVVSSIRTVGFAATMQPFKVFIPGVIILVITFKLCGLWR